MGGDPYVLWLTSMVLRKVGVRAATCLRWERERDTAGYRKTSGGFYVPLEIPTDWYGTL